MDDFNTLGKIISDYSTQEHVEDCVIEEMSELTKAIIKKRRGKGNIKNLTEEIGHVKLMCEALIRKYEIDTEGVHKEAEDAVLRMLKDK